ncbi:MAG: M48 family metalloprotease [Thermoanaerobaculia bacterium]
MRHLAARNLVLGGAVAAGLAIAACSVNPATGERQLTLISEQQELAMGAEYHEQVLASMPRLEDEAIQQYVAALGQRLAAASERPSLPWTFVVLDDPAVNAFAIPGGHIYITRGILTHFNSEAELASVLGHEIGHVTGRHSVEQMSKQQLLSIGLGVGMILSPEAAQLGDLAQLGAGLLVLRFGRQDELEADRLGLRYMAGADYDPDEMSKVFQTLGRVSDAVSGGQRLPNWLSTHPNPADRFTRIEAEKAALGAAGTVVGRDEYLDRIDGMVYGSDPRQGYFVGQAFYHPDMKFQITFPSGWKTANQTQRVVAASPQQDALVQLSLAGASPAQEAARKFVAQQGITAGSPRGLTVHGIQGVGAPFTATSNQQEVAGMAVFLDYGERTFQLLGYTPRTAWDGRKGELTGAIDSFRALTDRRYLDVEPARVDLVRLSAPTSVESFAARYPSSTSADELAILNGVDPGGTIPAGEAKRIVGGELPK